MTSIYERQKIGSAAIFLGRAPRESCSSRLQGGGVGLQGDMRSDTGHLVRSRASWMTRDDAAFAYEFSTSCRAFAEELIKCTATSPRG